MPTILPVVHGIVKRNGVAVSGAWVVVKCGSFKGQAKTLPNGGYVLIAPDIGSGYPMSAYISGWAHNKTVSFYNGQLARIDFNLTVGSPTVYHSNPPVSDDPAPNPTPKGICKGQVGEGGIKIYDVSNPSNFVYSRTVATGKDSSISLFTLPGVSTGTRTIKFYKTTSAKDGTTVNYTKSASVSANAVCQMGDTRPGGSSGK